MKKTVKRPKKREKLSDDVAIALIFTELETIKGDIEQMQRYIGRIAKVLRMVPTVTTVPTNTVPYTDVPF